MTNPSARDRLERQLEEFIDALLRDQREEDRHFDLEDEDATTEELHASDGIDTELCPTEPMGYPAIGFEPPPRETERMHRPSLAARLPGDEE